MLVYRMYIYRMNGYLYHIQYRHYSEGQNTILSRGGIEKVQYVYTTGKPCTFAAPRPPLHATFCFDNHKMNVLLPLTRASSTAKPLVAHQQSCLAFHRARCPLSLFSLQDFLICIEMFLAALAHSYAFPPKVN